MNVRVTWLYPTLANRGKAHEKNDRIVHDGAAAKTDFGLNMYVAPDAFRAKR
jgi:hypothetical protein